MTPPSPAFRSPRGRRAIRGEARQLGGAHEVRGGRFVAFAEADPLPDRGRDGGRHTDERPSPQLTQLALDLFGVSLEETDDAYREEESIGWHGPSIDGSTRRR